MHVEVQPIPRLWLQHTPRPKHGMGRKTESGAHLYPAEGPRGCGLPAGGLAAGADAVAVEAAAGDGCRVKRVKAAQVKLLLRGGKEPRDFARLVHPFMTWDNHWQALLHHHGAQRPGGDL